MSDSERKDKHRQPQRPSIIDRLGKDETDPFGDSLPSSKKISSDDVEIEEEESKEE